MRKFNVDKKALPKPTLDLLKRAAKWLNLKSKRPFCCNLIFERTKGKPPTIFSTDGRRIISIKIDLPTLPAGRYYIDPQTFEVSEVDKKFQSLWALFPHPNDLKNGQYSHTFTIPTAAQGFLRVCHSFKTPNDDINITKDSLKWFNMYEDDTGEYHEPQLGLKRNIRMCLKFLLGAFTFTDADLVFKQAADKRPCVVDLATGIRAAIMPMALEG